MFRIAGRNKVAFRSAKVAQGRSFRGAKGDNEPKLFFPRYLGIGQDRITERADHGYILGFSGSLVRHW